MSRLNRHAFDDLIKSDLEWLLEQPRTLERDHIKVCLQTIGELEYNLRAERDDYRVHLESIVKAIGSRDAYMAAEIRKVLDKYQPPAKASE